MKRHGASTSADVVVVGGGPGGSTVAAALAARGLRVTLLEQSRYESARFGEVLSPRVVPLLETLGVKGQFLAGGHAPSPGLLSVWGGSKAERPSLMNPYGDGWHVERARFDRMLAHAAAGAGVTLHAGARLNRVARDAGGSGWAVECSTPERTFTLHARFLVDATGRPAKLGRRLGARQERADRLIALVATGETPAGTDPRMLIEAAEGGWWYSAALPSGRSVFAYMTDADLLPRAHAGSRVAAFGPALRGAPHTSARARGMKFWPARVTSAASTRLPLPAGPGWLAVGDAVNAFDPLSAHGVAQAISSGIEAARVVAQYLSGAGRDERRSVVEDYASACGARWHRYLDERARIYGGETRWPQSPFWQRRRQRPAAVATGGL